MFDKLLTASTSQVTSSTNSTWSPASQLPYAWSKDVQVLKSPISSTTSFSFVGTGAWAKGTVIFEVSENAFPPSYDSVITSGLAVDQDHHFGKDPRMNTPSSRGQGFLEVRIEARWNDQRLWDHSSVNLERGASSFIEKASNELELTVKTPNQKAYTELDLTQLSFHVTISFPPCLTSLASLTTTGPGWRTVGTKSLSSLSFNNVSISTSDARISFPILNCGSGELTNSEGKIDGDYIATTSLRVKTSGAGIAGSFTAEEGELRFDTTSSLISVKPNARSIVVIAVRGTIEGVFEAKELLDVRNVEGRIEGTFAGSNVVLLTTDAPIRGSFTASESLVVKTTNQSIDGDVTMLPSSSRSEPCSELPEYEAIASCSSPTGRSLTADYASRKKDGEGFTPFHPVVAIATTKGSASIKYKSPFSPTFDLLTSNGRVLVDAPSCHTLNYFTNEVSRVIGEVTSSNLRDLGSSVVQMRANDGDARLSIR